jgi:hypothetical protein
MEPPVNRSARLLAAIPHGHSSPVLENSVFELTSRPICGRLFLRQNTGLVPQIRLSESPAAKPGFRRFGPSGATRYDRRDESANKSADTEACQIPMLLGSSLYRAGAIG